MEPPLSYDDLWPFQEEMKAMAHALLRLESQAVSLQTTALLVTALASVSKVEMKTWMALINKALFPSISTFETPPSVSRGVIPLSSLRGRGKVLLPGSLVYV